MAAPVSACPACDAAHFAEETAGRGYAGDGGEGKRIMLSLPQIYCAACIVGVESGLAKQPGVRSARVNLTLKRATVETDQGVEADDLAGYLTGIGFEAYELDAGALSSTETDKRSRDLLMRLGVAFFGMMNVMLLSVAVWSGASDATRDLFHWVSAGIALPIVAFSAQPFFTSAWSALRVRRLNMDVPISLAILLAAGMSVYETMHSGEHAYFDAALSLTFFLLAGRYLDHRTRAVARSAAEELAALEVPRAHRIVGEAEEVVAVSALAIGDLVRVTPGNRVPVDGMVETGESEVDRSLLTGESLPVFAGPGDMLNAGEVNLTGPLTLRVAAAGQDTALHRMADLVAIAETARNKYTSLADKAAAIYAPVVHLLALAAFTAWLVISGGDVRLSLNIAVAVLIITCPCALGLAVPAVTTAASGRLFKRGMLLKSATAMERLAEVDHVVFDKTGTLTEGAPKLENLGDHEGDDLSVALALAQGSSHPLAQAIAAAARAAGHAPVGLSHVTEVPGHGVEGEWNGQQVRLGRAEWVGAHVLGRTATYLKIGKQPAVAFTFTDALRDGAKEAVTALKSAGCGVTLISGDAEDAVRDVAFRLGIEDYRAGMLPDGKVAEVEALAASGKRVLMVGDGLNDTAALAAAHVSISPASALEAARVVSDIVLLGKSLAPLGDALITSRKATRRIKENFAIAASYNAIAIPVALLGFATPLAAALAMSASSIMVTLNALRLKVGK
ncbi:heavy metal translocating P-type ATPase [Maritimibacter sp. UBA3975]|uniref:heavy metal translocating P-type ATPase n=1 Tax=Maritimibacter sp. UBA3975 TaxID=1946833 RepID=UPI000C09C34E|nr:heavy metal translocating P-type ATPase [Maritimibacter sp. UBA3975]MAM62176.1 ATPase [Maritimibacter sp.]|tara:strand:- start:7880 stop:10078 length:2199 start_codon:yes stop_codon:yes gene_type:complete